MIIYHMELEFTVDLLMLNTLFIIFSVMFHNFYCKEIMTYNHELHCASYTMRIII